MAEHLSCWPLLMGVIDWVGLLRNMVWMPALGIEPGSSLPDIICSTSQWVEVALPLQREVLEKRKLALLLMMIMMMMRNRMEMNRSGGREGLVSAMVSIIAEFAGRSSQRLSIWN